MWRIKTKTLPILIDSQNKMPQNTYLVEMDVKDDKISFLHILPLQDFYGIFWKPYDFFLSNPSIKYKNNYLFLATTTKVHISNYHFNSRKFHFSLEELESFFSPQYLSNLIKIVDVKDTPKVIFSKNIAEYGLDGTYDILPY